MFDSPVLFIIYKRVDKTLKVFNAIKEIRPKNLFVAADGPKNENDRVLCDQTRAIIANVDWDCEVKTLYRDKNLGVKYNVSSAITWFFENVEEGIILEDDCVPCASFFLFCNQMLLKYRHNNDIMHISGSNLNNRTQGFEFTYYFSRYPNIWGWATWKRAWDKYDLELSDRNFYKNLIRLRFDDPFEKRFWNTVLNTLDAVDTWDYQWMFSIFKANGLCVNTNYNFIANIGFDESATHTIYESPNNNLPTKNINTISHPYKITVDEKKEAEFIFALHNLKRKGYFNFLLLGVNNFIHKIKLTLKLKRK